MKIRASQLGKLMTPPKTNKAKENGEFSETAKTYLNELAVWIYYKRKKIVRTDEMRKGIECEEESITTLTNYLGEGLFKNEEEYANDYFTGTPDLITEEVYDVKTAFDIFTFHNTEPPFWYSWDGRKKDWVLKRTEHYWQLQAYMDLLGLEQGYIARILANTPPKMVEDKKYRMQFQYADGEEDLEYQEDVDYLERLHNYDDLDLSEKVKLYPVEKSEEDLEAAKEAVVTANEYLKDWEL